MLGTRTLFRRSLLGDGSLPVRHVLGALDASTDDALLPSERADMAKCLDEQKACCPRCLDARARGLEPCTNGVRVLTRDSDGKPTAAEMCDAPAANKPSEGGKLTPDQQKQIGAALGAAVNALGQFLSPPPKNTPAPSTPSMIDGVPDAVIIVGALVVIVVVVVRVGKKG